MAKIFVSYARENAAAAQIVADALEEAGLEVWWDRHISAGSRFAGEIEAALQSADVVLVLWSTASIESAWVKDEAAQGVEQGCLVPALLDGCRPPLGFRQYQAIDIAGWQSAERPFDALIRVIQTKLSTGKDGSAGSSEPRLQAAARLPIVFVAPFKNMSPDAEQDYFSDGITDDVITDLSKVSALAVIPRSTAFAHKGQTIDAKQVALELGVTHILEGTVRKSATQLRISVQLIDASTTHNVWAERYDRELTDVFEIQDEISHAIVESLQLTLLPGERAAIEERATNDTQAYDIYLKARAIWLSGKAGDQRWTDEVVQLCTDATRVDPNYAGAWALLALAEAELRLWHGRTVDPLVAAERALAIDPRLPQPHCARARRFEEQGDDDKCQAAIETALALDDISWEANCEAGQALFRRGQVQKAIPFFEKAATAMAHDHASAAMLIFCYRAVGDTAGMQRAAQVAVKRGEVVIVSNPRSGGAFASVASGLAALGEADRAKRWIRKALNVDPGNLAMRYSLGSTLVSLLDDAAEGLTVLEPFAEAATLRPHLRLLELDPGWDSVRANARFLQMLDGARNRVQSLAPR
ncbi:MAG: TIR domain-containing protein [Sphingomonas sp.]|nr:TIR domain-containing protein [Sphingomonas sp.]